MTRRGPDEFRAEMAARKGATLLALNELRIEQERGGSGAGTNAPSIDEAVCEINQLLNQADATRLDAGRRLLALRARVEAGEVGSEVKWWEFYAEHFTRSRKDAEKLMRLAGSDDPEAAVAAERQAQKIRDDRKRQRGAGPAPSAAAELIHEQQLRTVEQNADFGRGRGDDTGFPDGGSEGDCATGGHEDRSDPGRGDPDDLGNGGDPAGHDDHGDRGGDCNWAKEEKPGTADDPPPAVADQHGDGHADRISIREEIRRREERSQTITEIWEAADPRDRDRVRYLVLYEFFKAPHPYDLYTRLKHGDFVDTLAGVLAHTSRDDLWRVVRELAPDRREMLRKRLNDAAEKLHKRHERLNKPRTINLTATSSTISGDPAGKDEVPVPAGTPSDCNGQ